MDFVFHIVDERGKSNPKVPFPRRSLEIRFSRLREYAISPGGFSGNLFKTINLIVFAFSPRITIMSIELLALLLSPYAPETMSILQISKKKTKKLQTCRIKTSVRPNPTLAFSNLRCQIAATIKDPNFRKPSGK